MNTITRRLVQGSAIAAIGGALALAGAGAANAATPSTQRPTDANSPTQLGSTQGFQLYNYSADTFDFIKTDGSLPAPPTAPIQPGQKVNFEIDSPAFSVKSGTAYYNVIGPDGTQIGTFNATLYSNGTWKFSDTYTNTENLISVAGTNNDDDIYIEDGVGSPNTTQNLAGGSSAEQSVISSVCDTNRGACSFSNVTETTDWSQPKLIAQGYNGQTVSGTLNAGKSYTDQTTDTWGATVTAQGELGPVTASVQASYSHAVTTGTELDVSDSATELPDYTTYIWGRVWQYVDSGTFVAHLGNTTWTMPDVTIYSADNNPDNPITFVSTQTHGDVTLPPNSVLNS